MLKQTKVHIDLLYKTPELKKKITIKKQLLETCFLKTIELVNFPSQIDLVEVCLLSTCKNSMQALNKKFLSKDYITNVLSFPNLNLTPPNFDSINEEKSIYIGDIAIGYEVVVKEAKELDMPIEVRFLHLFIHGLLHLLGYDHDTLEKTLQMQQLETAILDAVDINAEKEKIINSYHTT
jgi:probable rRNA maturation factor